MFRCAKAQRKKITPRSLSYQPPPSLFGIDQFRYKVCYDACPDRCDVGIVTFSVEAPPGFDTTVVAPNVITPDGDGLNDIWIVKNLEDYPNNTVFVFNRWGEMVYTASPYTNDWGGVNKQGNPLSHGVYYYILRLDVGEGKIEKGWLMIMNKN